MKLIKKELDKKKNKRNENITEAPICCGKPMCLASGRNGTGYFQCNKCGGCSIKDMNYAEVVGDGK